MNYKTYTKTNNLFKKATKGLIVFCTFYFLTSFVSHAQALPSCTDSSVTSPNPGVNCIPPQISCNALSSPNAGVNCLLNCNDSSIGNPEPGANCLYFDLPICTTNPYATSMISSPQPRQNCADLIDMPLCSNVTGAVEGKNCVLECANITDSSDPSQIRGVHYARHAIDCVRFEGATLSDGTPTTEVLTDTAYLALDPIDKYTARKCHQSVEGYTDTSGCEQLSCNLLTVDELDERKFIDGVNNNDNPDDDIQYCDNSEKCYNFDENKLPYLMRPPTQKLCTPHECQPEFSPASPFCSDETIDVIAKGEPFVQSYAQHIMYIDPSTTPLAALNPPDNQEIREQLSNNCKTRATICRKIIDRNYYCNDDGSLNSECDSTSVCNDKNQCTKAIDCNDPALAAEPECVSTVDCDDPANASHPQCSGVTTIISDAWFFNPKPPKKSTNSVGELHSDMNKNDICYSKQDLEDNGWGYNLKIPNPWGPDLDLGYFHHERFEDSRSPGHCSAAKINVRGAGYLYLCGNESNINAEIDKDRAAYHDKEAETIFTNTDTITNVKVCLRFRNLLYPYTATGDEICGKRECAISCNGNLGCLLQYCGNDLCTSLQVRKTDALKCMMDGDMFDNDNGNYDCAQIVDNFLGIGGMLRLRAVQYSNKVCTFLDSNGQLAYNDMFMTGKEKLSDGTCLAEVNSDGECDGKNSNDSKELAHKWRAVMRIPFVNHDSKLDGHPTFAGAKGYLNADNHLVREQECVKIPLRVRTPRLYNLATTANSSRFFKPPLYILESYVQKGGNISLPTSHSQTLGPTDFNYPEINVKYGVSTEQKLSLSLGKTGFETDSFEIDPQSTANITTTYNGVDYSTTISIRKEYNSASRKPYLCLYETVKDTHDIARNYKIQCIDRTLPEIQGNIENSQSTRQLLITDPAPANSYNDANISIQYEGQHPTNPSGGTVASDAIILSNSVQNTPQCNAQTEQYKVCAQRGECTKLVNECVQNEINIQNGLPSDAGLKFECDNTLKDKCNKQLGIVGDSTDANAYGWFNEICVSSGFESKLRNVKAHKMADPSIMGKCVIDTTKSTGDCSKGGKPQESGTSTANCICAQIDELSDSEINDYYIRKQTPREAGLCIDIPEPELCSNTLYDHTQGCSDQSCIDTARTAATAVGNADFVSSAFGGMKAVTGLCKDNWTYQKDSSGHDLLPTMDCVTSVSGTQWDTSSIKNECQRFSCPQIASQSQLILGNIEYTNNYSDPSETQDYDTSNTSLNKGYRQGYALWPRTSSDDDGVSANGICITGYENTGGTAPTRLCSPRGDWQTITNACTRIMCPAITPDDPSQYDQSTQSTQWNNAWQSWSDSGGATFNTTPASRIAMLSDTDPVAPTSIAQGTCNNSLGFFQGGVYPPTYQCDADGSWRNLQNPCVTRCDAVTASSPYNVNNGNALWNQGEVAVGEPYADGDFNGCAAGYVQYPYSAPKDKFGNNINSTADPHSSYRIKVDTTPLDPQRVCYSVYTGGTYATYWGTAYPACTNKCPGASTDARVGVGVTKHQLSDGTYRYFEWADANPGEVQIKYSSLTLQDVEHYYAGNTGTFAVKRVCGSDYRWVTYTNAYGQEEDVKPQCSARDLVVDRDNENITNSHAIFGSTTVETIDEGTSLTANYCKTGYGNKNNNMPEYECVEGSSARYIDQFYYRQKTGSPTCIQMCHAINNNNYGAGSMYDGNNNYHFPGEKVNLTCRNLYGHASGTPTCSGDLCNNGVKQCGRRVNTTDNSRIQQHPTMTCQSDGTWSVTNDCTQCNQCRCDATNCGAFPHPFILSVNDTRRVAHCTYNDDDGSKGDDVYTSGPYVRSDAGGCGNSGDTTRHMYPGIVSSGSYQDVTGYGSDSGDSVTWRFTCYDGLFIVQQTEKTGDPGDMQTIFK